MIMGRDLVEELKRDSTLDTLIKVDEIMCDAEDVFIDFLTERDISLTEYSLAKYFVENYIDVVRDLICDDFGVTRFERNVDEEIEDCDGDCENCPLNDAE